MELILALLDKAIQLFKERQGNRRALYAEFVVPAIESLTAVHNDYLASFRRYRESLGDPRVTPADLISIIRQDALYSSSLRAQLGALETYAKHKDLGPFIESIVAYLGGKDYAGYTTMNMYRAGILCQAIDAIELRGPILNDRQQYYLDHIAQLSREDSNENSVYREVRRDLGFLQRHEMVNFDREITPLPVEEVSKLDQAWRQYMQTVIDDRVQQIQSQYALVIREHARLKKLLYSDAYGAQE